MYFYMSGKQKLFQKIYFSVFSESLYRCNYFKVYKNENNIRIANHPYIQFFQNKFEYNFKSFLKNFIYRFSDGIITNSKESLNYFKNKNFKNELIHIYNPIKNLKNTHTGNKKNKKFILSIGRLEKQKNFLGLLKAFKLVTKKFKFQKLIIVGSGSEKNTLTKYINENN